MERKRKVYAPFSLTSEAGVAQTPVEGYIDVNQAIYPTVNTGTVNENGKWVGVKASDDEFIGFTKAEAVANGGEVLFPDTNNHPSINMTDYTTIFLAFKSSRTGNVAMEAVMGPDTVSFANLQPVSSGTTLRLGSGGGSNSTYSSAFSDSAETIADTWSVFQIQDRVANFKNMQFKVTNNTGGSADIEFAFMRVI